MAETQSEHTLVILKPDSFWRRIHHEVAARIHHLGLHTVAECILADGANLPEEKWREFYVHAIGHIPPIHTATSQYMAFGPVQVVHLRGVDAIQTVRRAIGATRPWQAEKGTIRGDFWPGADEANAPFLPKFRPPGDKNFLFNLIHASDCTESFKREIRFFDQLQASAPGTGD